MDLRFESELFQILMVTLKVKKIQTCDYRPSTNGLVQ